MNRLEAIAKVEKWWNSVTVVTEEEFEQLYQVYYEKLETIDEQCEGYTDFEDVPNLHFWIRFRACGVLGNRNTAINGVSKIVFFLLG